jgi:hypothetical protein
VRGGDALIVIELLAVWTSFLALYFGIPIYLCFRGWPIRAGVAMLLVAVLPLLIERLHTGYGSEGDGIFLLFALPLPIGLFVVGVILLAMRLVKRLRGLA